LCGETQLPHAASPRSWRSWQTFRRQMLRAGQQKQAIPVHKGQGIAGLLFRARGESIRRSSNDGVFSKRCSTVPIGGRAVARFGAARENLPCIKRECRQHPLRRRCHLRRTSCCAEGFDRTHPSMAWEPTTSCYRVCSQGRSGESAQAGGDGGRH